MKKMFRCLFVFVLVMTMVMPSGLSLNASAITTSSEVAKTIDATIFTYYDESTNEVKVVTELIGDSEQITKLQLFVMNNTLKEGNGESASLLMLEDYNNGSIVVLKADATGWKMDDQLTVTITINDEVHTKNLTLADLS